MLRGAGRAPLTAAREAALMAEALAILRVAERATLMAVAMVGQRAVAMGPPGPQPLQWLRARPRESLSQWQRRGLQYLLCSALPQRSRLLHLLGHSP